jgi:predicted phage terminase large subunit-like protein
MFISTPNGLNWFRDLFVSAGSADGWARWQRPTADNPIVTAAEIEAAHKDMGSRFTQEFLAAFTKPEGSEWPESYFGPDAWFDEWPLRPQAKVLALDPSKGKGDKWGDDSAFIKMMYRDGIMYVDADMANDRDIHMIADVAIELQRTFRSNAFAIEINGFQECLADSIDEACRTSGILLPLYGLNNYSLKKEIRIRRLTPFLSRGMVKFKGGSAGAKRLVDQLRDFPNGEHDDGPDALEMAVRVLLEIVNTVEDGLGTRLPV